MITKKALVSAVVAVFAVVSARATDYTLVSGENELTAEMNAAGNRLIAVSGSVLKLTGAATDGVYTISCAITAQAGELVIDATGVTDLATLRMTKNLGSDGKGSVTFKGVDKLVYGLASNPSRTGNITWNEFATIDTELSFKGSAGEPIASPTVVFTNGVFIRTKPNYAFSIAEGALIAPYTVDSLTSKIVSVEGTPTLTADTWDLFLVKAGAVPAGTKIVAHGNLLFKPVTCSAPGYSWGGSSDSPFTNDLQLVNDATFLNCNRTQANTLKGAVSGSGTLLMARSGGMTFGGNLSFEGRVVLDWSEKDGGNFVKFCSSSPGAVTNAIEIKKGTVPSNVYLQPTGYGTTPTIFTMGDFISSDGAENVTLYTYAQQTVSMQTLTGRLHIDGASTVSIAKLAEGAKVYVPGGAKLIVGERAPTAKIFLVKGPDDSCDWSVSGPAAGDPIELSFEYPADLTTCTMTLGGKAVCYDPLPAGCSRLTVETGAQIQLVIDPAAEVFPVQNHGGSLEILGMGEKWSAKVGLWLAADKALTLAKDCTAIAETQTKTRADTFVNNELAVWGDCRGTGSYAMTQIRYTTLGDASFTKILYPIYHADGGPANKAYVDFFNDSKARMALTVSGGWSQSYLSAKHVLMVYANRSTGCKALIAEKNGWFIREAGSAKALVKTVAATNTCVIATNGVAIASPTTTPPTGDWQILSLAIHEKDTDLCRTLSIGGLGGQYNGTSSSDNGGQRYAEIIIFDREPTEAELGCAEAYLSAKWGLPVQPRQAAETAGAVSIQGGDGTYVFNANATLTGHYKGTLDLNGQKVTLPSGSLPYTEAEIPSSGRVLWVDPSLSDALVLDEDPDHPAFANDVAGIKPRDANGLVETKDAKCLLGVRHTVKSSYRPAYLATAKAYGAATGWIDYDNDHSGDSTGNTLMLSTLPISTNYVDLTKANAVELTVRSLFLVLDSSRGGGSTYLSWAGGSNGDLRHRGAKPLLTDPIWSENCADAIKNGVTRLDGVAVNGAENGFTGKPEVMSAIATADVKAKALGHYGDTERQECFAETLLYSTALGDADRAGIESYLMLKWLDKLPAGYADFRQATVTGAGTLVAPSLKHLPQLGAGFEGSVELGGFGEAFVINGAGAAQNAVTFSAYAPKLVDATVDVNVTKYASGAHLVASGVATGSTVTLGSVTGFESERVRARVEGDKVYVDLIPRGMVLIVK